MATTPGYKLPTPDHPMEADGPEQFMALATAIENLLTTGTLKMTGGAIELPSPAGSANPVTLGYLNARFVIGPAASAPASMPTGSVYFGT